MDRDRQQAAAFKSNHQEGRREWGRSGGEQHQAERREHSRQAGKTHRTHDLRVAEAARQIRELRTRY